MLNSLICTRYLYILLVLGYWHPTVIILQIFLATVRFISKCPAIEKFIPTNTPTLTESSCLNICLPLPYIEIICIKLSDYIVWESLEININKIDLYVLKVLQHFYNKNMKFLPKAVQFQSPLSGHTFNYHIRRRSKTTARLLVQYYGPNFQQFSYRFRAKVLLQV